MPEENVNAVDKTVGDLGKLATLAQLADQERQLTAQLTDVRADIEERVRELLDVPHPPRGLTTAVVRATGYSRAWIDRLRRGQTGWRRPTEDAPRP